MKNDHTKFGVHLIVDAYGCPLDRLNSMELCFDFLNNVVVLGKMQKFHEPYIIKADSNEALGGKDPGGFSGFVMIHESHASVHTFAKRGFVTIDVYSCKEFDSEEVLSYIKNTFKPKDIDIIKMDRGMKYPNHNIY